MKAIWRFIFEDASQPTRERIVCVVVDAKTDEGTALKIARKGSGCSLKLWNSYRDFEGEVV